jgi:hypothetical protein
METKHTAGPWEARSRSVSDGALIVTDSEHNELCCVVEKKYREYGPEDKQRIANAVLMAAAPLMLSTLKAIRSEQSSRRVIEQIDAVIAKATQC